MLLLAVAAAVLVGTLAQAVSGFGFSLVCGPLLVAALGARDGVRLGVLLSAVLNVALLVRFRRDVDLGKAALLAVPSVLATPFAVALAHSLPERPAQAAAGGVVMLGVLLLASGFRWRAARGRVGAIAVGVVAAGTNAVASVAGPPIAVWAANAEWDPIAQRATLQAYFLALNLVAAPVLGLPRTGLDVPVISLVAMAAGVCAGGPLARRITARAAGRTTLVLAAVGAGVVLCRAIV